MSEPVSLDIVKEHLRLDVGDTSEDAYLSGLIVAARRACEKRIDRSVVGAVEILTLDRFPGADSLWPYAITLEARSPRARDIVLAGGSIASVTALVYFDRDGAQQTLASGSYYADLADEPAVLAPIGAWPGTAERPDAVTITYTVSPLAADDLAMVVQAMLLLIGGWYRNPEAVAVDQRGVPAELPLSVTWLLEPLRQWPTE
jgi:uncharacterized phiE125 gp8 family phage protein